MALDFWNNPLVVSALRQLNRRAGLSTTLAAYTALLGCGCIAIWYVAPWFAGRPVPPQQIMHWLFAGLFILQTALSTYLALLATSVSIVSEVSTGTLDYQRLTPLTPAQVLTGKLLGPPATAYLLLVASVPFTFGLWSVDASAISLGSLLLLYLQQVCTVLLGACAGLVKPLRTTPGKKGTDASGGGCLLLVFLLPAFGGGIAALPMLLSQPQTAALGLLLPIGPLAGLAQYDDPWHHSLRCFDAPVPFMLVTPLVQLAAGILLFVCMVRRLTNTANPPLSKRSAYITLLAIDVIASAVLFDPFLLELGPRSTGYWLVHFLSAYYLAVQVTPDRELLMSWIWRYRDRCPYVRDLGWRDRSENIVVLLLFCGIGVAVYLLLVAAPAVLVAGWDEAEPATDSVIFSAILACLLTLSLGTLLQAGRFLFGKGGGSIVLVPIILDVLAFSFGQQFHIPWLLDSSVMAHWSSWHGQQPALSPVPVLLVHGLLFLWCWRMLRRGVRIATARVERTLREMGAAVG
jgi:hypothetical protein